MTILKCFNKEQKNSLKKFQSLSGFEPMHQDEFASGEMSFEELWRRNQQWMADVQNEVEHIQAPVNEIDIDGCDVLHYVTGSIRGKTMKYDDL